MVFELDVVVPGLGLTKDRGAPCGGKVDHTRRGDLHDKGASRSWSAQTRSRLIASVRVFGGLTDGSTTAFRLGAFSTVRTRHSGSKAVYPVPTK